jgi:hypothetical protein
MKTANIEWEKQVTPHSSLWTQVRETRTVTIARPFSEVVRMLSDPLDYLSWLGYSRWAIAYFTSPVTEIDEGIYRVQTSVGDRRIKVDVNPEAGIVELSIAALNEPFGDALPIRVLHNGDCADVLFTVPRDADTSEAEWQESLLALEDELAAMKRHFELPPTPNTRPEPGEH